jgi:hypothetical protein
MRLTFPTTPVQWGFFRDILPTLTSTRYSAGFLKSLSEVPVSKGGIAVLIWMRYSAIGFKAEGKRQRAEVGVFHSSENCYN